MSRLSAAKSQARLPAASYYENFSDHIYFYAVTANIQSLLHVAFDANIIILE